MIRDEFGRLPPPRGVSSSALLTALGYTHGTLNESEILEMVRYLAKFEKQAKLVDLANQAAHLTNVGGACRITRIDAPEDVEVFVNDEPAALGQIVRTGDRLSTRGSKINPEVRVFFTAATEHGGAAVPSVRASHPGHASLEAPATALDMWRTLLALADDSVGGKIDAEQWAGLCGNMFALLRSES